MMVIITPSYFCLHTRKGDKEHCMKGGSCSVLFNILENKQTESESRTDKVPLLISAANFSAPFN
jgi:hypothetical protein